MLKGTLARLAAVATITASTVVLAPSVANSATVPNRMMQVYSCTYWGTACRYSHYYQMNPPYNPRVETWWYCCEYRNNRWW